MSLCGLGLLLTENWLTKWLSSILGGYGFIIRLLCDSAYRDSAFRVILVVLLTYCLFSYQCSHLSFCIKIRAKPLTEERRLVAHDSVLVNFIDFS